MTVKTVGLPGMFLIEPRWEGTAGRRFGKLLAGHELAEQRLDFQLFDINVAETAEAGAIRGLHHQLAPHEETKICQVLAGSLFDVCVDVRPHSSTFGQWFGLELRPTSGILYIPHGLAHGYQTLEPDTRVMYLVSAGWAPEHERGVRWDDPGVGIEWPMAPAGVSEKDQAWPDLELAD